MANEGTGGGEGERDLERSGTEDDHRRGWRGGDEQMKLGGKRQRAAAGWRQAGAQGHGTRARADQSPPGLWSRYSHSL